MQLTRNELHDTLRQNTFPAHQISLFTGDSFLCQQAAQLLIDKIESAETVTVHDIAGNAEDPATTLARLQSYSLLPGRQIYRVTESQLFHSKTVAAELWKKAEAANNNEKTAAAVKHLHAFAAAVSLKIESPGQLAEMPPGEWKKLFSFDKPNTPLQWADTLLFATRDRIKQGTSSLVDAYLAAFKTGFPPANVLILLAETVDKRHRLYNWIKKSAVVIDCSVASGSSSAAQREQKDVLKEIMLATLQKFNKKIDSRCTDLFFERVGFHPVAVVNELEKLVHYAGDRPTITAQDLEEMVGRSREDALYELTDALGKRDPARTLAILNRLLSQGIHGLAILATLRNYTRKHLIYRTIQLSSTPRWRHGIQAREFQHKYLPILKENETWAPFLTGHPYALFVNFTKASEFSCNALKQRLKRILKAEYRLKGSPLSQEIVLQELLFSLLKGAPGR